MITVKTQVISTLQSMNQWNLLLSFLMVLTERKSVNLPLALFRMGGGGSAKRFSARFFLVYFFYQGFFSQTLTTHRTAGKGKGTIFYSTLPLLPAHKYSDIYLQLCMWDDYHIFLITSLVFTRLLLDEIYHLIELPFDWLMMWH